MPMTLFHALALWHPPITIQISRILARRMRTDMDMRETARRMALPPHLATTIGRGQSTHNFKTVAVLPTSSDVPIAAFTQQLQAACRTVLAEPVVVLRQSTVIRELGRHAFSRMGKLKLAVDIDQISELNEDRRALWEQVTLLQAFAPYLVGPAECA